MRRLVLLVLILLLLVPSAFAEDVCLIDSLTDQEIRTSCPYIRVNCPIGNDVHVTLTIRDGWGGLIYQRDHGICSGTFRSGEIHLPLDGEETLYRLTLTANGTESTLHIIREKPFTVDSAVYARGLSLSELTGGSLRKYAVILDTAALKQGSQTFPLIAGDVQVGEAIFRIKETALSCEVRLSVNGTVEKAKLYIATDTLTAGQFGNSRFSGLTGKPGKSIDIGNAPYIAVMLHLTVAYDADDLPTWQQNPVLIKTQQSLWQEMQQLCGANG